MVVVSFLPSLPISAYSTAGKSVDIPYGGKIMCAGNNVLVSRICRLAPVWRVGHGAQLTRSSGEVGVWRGGLPDSATETDRVSEESQCGHTLTIRERIPEEHRVK